MNIIALLLVMVLPMLAVFVQPAHAANFTEVFVRIDRMKAETASSGTVCAKPATTGTEAKVLVTFPTGFTVNGTAGNWTVTTTNLPTGGTAWVGIDTATVVSSQTVTFTSGELTVGTKYCFNFSGTSTLTTSTAGANKEGTVTTKTSGDAVIDSSEYTTAVVSNDQIVLTAIVPPTFSFSLGATSDAFTTDLSQSSVVSTTGVTATIATNANNGWYAWVKSANAALSSATTAEDVDTVGTIDDATSTLSVGAEGYVLDVDLTTDSSTGDGVVSIDDEYNGNTTSKGGTLSTNYQEIASATGTTDGDIVTLIARASISAVQEAASDYTDTLTVVGAGRF